MTGWTKKEGTMGMWTRKTGSHTLCVDIVLAHRFKVVAFDDSRCEVWIGRARSLMAGIEMADQWAAAQAAPTGVE